jgi:hypothetical protein
MNDRRLAYAGDRTPGIARMLVSSDRWNTWALARSFPDVLTRRGNCPQKGTTYRHLVSGHSR